MRSLHLGQRPWKLWLAPDLLCLDELGYLPLDKTGADLLFQIISQRYEHGSIVLTTNKAYKHWPAIFNNDYGITAAILEARVLSGTPKVSAAIREQCRACATSAVSRHLTRRVEGAGLRVVELGGVAERLAVLPSRD